MLLEEPELLELHSLLDNLVLQLPAYILPFLPQNLGVALLVLAPLVELQLVFVDQLVQVAELLYQLANLVQGELPVDLLQLPDVHQL